MSKPTPIIFRCREIPTCRFLRRVELLLLLLKSTQDFLKPAPVIRRTSFGTPLHSRKRGKELSVLGQQSLFRGVQSLLPAFGERGAYLGLELGEFFFVSILLL